MLFTAAPSWGFSWDKDNTLLHVPLTLAMAVDLVQSLEIASAQETKCFHYVDGVCVETREVYKHWESNPLLGEHPQEHEVYTYFLTSYVITTALVYVLPEKWSHALQGGVIGLEAGYIDRNYRAGVRINF